VECSGKRSPKAADHQRVLKEIFSGRFCLQERSVVIDGVEAHQFRHGSGAKVVQNRVIVGQLAAAEIVVVIQLAESL
jgi:hypothetical protein